MMPSIHMWVVVFILLGDWNSNTCGVIASADAISSLACHPKQTWASMEDDQYHAYCICRSGFHGPSCEYSGYHPRCTEHSLLRGLYCVADQNNDVHILCPTRLIAWNSTCKEFPCRYPGTRQCHSTADLLVQEVSYQGRAFQCDCHDGFQGIQCEINIDECMSLPCQHDGICHDSINGFQCDCVPGFKGEFCQTNIDECASAPCPHSLRARCVDQVNGYECQCQNGWTGKECEVEIDECQSSPCANQGTCYDGIASFLCKCPNGWSGTVCDVAVDECASTPCQNNGLCSDRHNEYLCVCQDGFYGNHCEHPCPCAHQQRCRIVQVKPNDNTNNNETHLILPILPQIECLCNHLLYTGDNCSIIVSTTPLDLFRSFVEWSVFGNMASVLIPWFVVIVPVFILGLIVLAIFLYGRSFPPSPPVRLPTTLSISDSIQNVDDEVSNAKTPVFENVTDGPPTEKSSSSPTVVVSSSSSFETNDQHALSTASSPPPPPPNSAATPSLEKSDHTGSSLVVVGNPSSNLSTHAVNPPMHPSRMQWFPFNRQLFSASTSVVPALQISSIPTRPHTLPRPPPVVIISESTHRPDS